mmetsp:Transcript_8729/g.20024  ORF Transcript_8729/g.20024 Transcript_8729/m.20024 type:complete len:731 (-) Transcript_8729:93-2285(-)
MLFVPQAPMDSCAGGFAVEPGYMVCMMQPRGAYASGQPGEATPVQPLMEVPSPEAPGDWAPAPRKPASGGGIGASKALVIRNPKTGEVVGGDREAPALAKESTECMSEEMRKALRIEKTRQVLLEKTNLPNMLLRSAKLRGGTAAKVMSKRGQAAMWCTDRSTFSALNIDSVARPYTSGPLKSDLQAHTDEARALAEVRPQEKAAPKEQGATAKAVDKAKTIAALRNRMQKAAPWAPSEPLILPKKVMEAAMQESDETEAKTVAGNRQPWRPKFLVSRQDSAEPAPEAEESKLAVASAAEEDASASTGETEPESMCCSTEVPDTASDKEAPLTDEISSERMSFIGAHEAMVRSLLSYRGIVAEEKAPVEVANLFARQLERAPAPPPLQSPTSSSAATPSGRDRRATKGQSSESLPTPSNKAWHLSPKGSPMSKEAELRRTVQGLLNKICPENVATIAKKMSQIKVRTSLQLESLIDLIFRKALAEPHYCETYADLIFSLKSEFPEFPSPNEGEGAKPVSFRSSVLNICQNEFERTLFPPEEQSEDAAAEEGCGDAREKARMLANMKFIGHLFLRQLLSAKVIGSVIQELTLCDQVDKLPQEHAVECACELLLNIGFTLESMAAGSQTLSQVCGRLLELKQRKTPEGRGAYSKRIQFTIQNLLDTRAARWHQKTFRSRAKTMEEIRLEQTQQLAAQARGAELESGEQVVAGQRPQYMAAVAASPLQRKPTL